MVFLFCEFFLYNFVCVRCFNWIFFYKLEYDLREYYDECYEYSSSREIRDVLGFVVRRL